jgi:DNA invertase Pin-like site-specific DNA recombinase
MLGFKLDRLTRNVAFLANLMETDVEFVACGNPHATWFTLHIPAAVAEHERAMIPQRTKAALRAAKEYCTVLGGYRGTQAPDACLGALPWRPGPMLPAAHPDKACTCRPYTQVYGS